MFSCWQGNELAFVKNKKSILEWHTKYSEYELTRSDLKAETVACTYKRYHKISTHTPQPYAFRFHDNSEYLLKYIHLSIVSLSTLVFFYTRSKSQSVCFCNTNA